MWICASGIYKVKNSDGTGRHSKDGGVDFLNMMTGGFAGAMTQGSGGYDKTGGNTYHDNN